MRITPSCSTNSRAAPAQNSGLIGSSASVLETKRTLLRSWSPSWERPSYVPHSGSRMSPAPTMRRTPRRGSISFAGTLKAAFSAAAWAQEAVHFLPGIAATNVQS